MSDRAMNDPVCKNCGEVRTRHKEGTDGYSHVRICWNGTFEAKPEAPKAKPGVRYKKQFCGGWQTWAVGLASGKILNGSVVCALDSDWTEVPE